MPVPKRRQSHTRSAKRKANWKAQPPTYSECPQCHQPKLPHRVCGTAGTTRVARRSRSSSAWHGSAPRRGRKRSTGPSWASGSVMRRSRELALTHRSYAFEQELPANNERLEFLGDAVLGIVVTDMAFRDPDPEGELAKLRAAIVNMSALADAARDLGLGRLILLGRGEEMSGGQTRAASWRMRSRPCWARSTSTGACPRRASWSSGCSGPRMIAYVRGEGERDYKTILQELASAEVHSVPDYRIPARPRSPEGVHGDRVPRRQEEWGSGIGRSKKEAEQQAAHEAYVRLSERAEPAEPAGAWGDRETQKKRR